MVKLRLQCLERESRGEVKIGVGFAEGYPFTASHKQSAVPTSVRSVIKLIVRALYSKRFELVQDRTLKAGRAAARAKIDGITRLG